VTLTGLPMSLSTPCCADLATCQLTPSGMGGSRRQACCLPAKCCLLHVLAGFAGGRPAPLPSLLLLLDGSLAHLGKFKLAPPCILPCRVPGPRASRLP
jgi:hypothetical protein